MSLPRLIQTKLIISNASQRDECLQEGAIAIQDGIILEIAPLNELERRYPDAEILGSDQHLAIPGFIDAHNHGQGLTSFSQGLQDDILEIWSITWPRLLDKPEELSFLDPLISAGRQIRSGVTSTMLKRMDSPPLPLPEYRIEVEKVIEAYNHAGIRLTFALGTTDKASNLVYIDNKAFIESLPTSAQSSANELSRPKARILLPEILGLIDDLHQRHIETDMTSVAVAITGPQWVSDDFLLPLAEKAISLSIPLHGPLLESFHQKLYAQQILGHTVLEHLDHYSLLNERFSLAHGIWLKDIDMELLSSAGGTVVHCPSSNLRFHGGIAPVKRMLEKGVNVGLAVDSEGINDNDDTFQEMRLASLLHRLPGQGKKLDAWDILAMATINGARAMGLERQIGSLEPGKKADLVLIDIEKLYDDYLDPTISLVDALVYRGKPSAIDLVMVDGEVVFINGKHTKFDFDEARQMLKDIMEKIDRSAEYRRVELVKELLPYIRSFYAGWKPKNLEPYYFPNAKN